METFINFICPYAHDAHWIIFLLIMLAGLNVPISEDLLMLTGGVLAATCVPEHTLRMFMWIWAACIFSAWETYWIGRLLGPKLYNIRWFSHILPPHRVERLHYYYEKFHILTFIAGRFIPFGVRNALFLSSGLGKMPFNKFVIRDGIASFISTNTFFFLGFTFGNNYPILQDYIHKYEYLGGAILLGIVAVVATVIWYKTRKKADSSEL